MNKKKARQPMEGEKVGKDESIPTLSRIVPMYWAFSGRTGTLQCFVGLILASRFSPNLFNCWQGMRRKYLEFNVKNHFHFSPPTIESFILFFGNDTLHYAILTSSEQQRGPHSSCSFPQYHLFPPRVFTALESKGPCLISQVQQYFVGVEDTGILQHFSIIS